MSTVRYTLPPDLFKDMSLEFLETLESQDEATFFEFFQQLNLEDIKQARQKAQKVQEENRDLALKNSEQQPNFIQRKEELRVRVTEAQNLKEEYDKYFQELKTFQNKRELPSVRKELVEATKESEDTSEDFSLKFVSGKTDLSVDVFIEQLLEKRSEYWTRKVKLEKLDELCKNRQPQPTPRPRASIPTPTPFPSQSYQQMPLQSLPLGRGITPSFPQGPRRTSDSAVKSSLSPYPSAQPNMPLPQSVPYGAPSFSGSYPQPMAGSHPQAGYPPQRPAVRHQAIPPRPVPYSEYNQHRY